MQQTDRMANPTEQQIPKHYAQQRNEQQIPKHYAGATS
jgi:hypothetical protein